MTTFTPLAILAALIAALTQLDDPFTAAAVLLFCLAMASKPRRPRVHLPGDPLI